MAIPIEILKETPSGMGEQTSLEVPEAKSPKFHPFLGCPRCRAMKLQERLLQDGVDGRNEPVYGMRLRCAGCGHTLPGHFKAKRK